MATTPSDPAWKLLNPSKAVAVGDLGGSTVKWMTEEKPSIISFDGMKGPLPLLRDRLELDGRRDPGLAHQRVVRQTAGRAAHARTPVGAEGNDRVVSVAQPGVSVSSVCTRTPSGPVAVEVEIG